MKSKFSRRSQRLDVGLDLVSIKEPIHLIIDSMGLSIVGEGEWAALWNGDASAPREATRQGASASRDESRGRGRPRFAAVARRCIVDITISDERAASVVLHADHWNGKNFIDHFHLLKIDGTWKILSKINSQ